ncbi:MAG: MltA domain-containing protein [SAR324 cluster bacterium]|nr:MltA domain-containing protein [SAR324 cluster bacterium]
MYKYFVLSLLFLSFFISTSGCHLIQTPPVSTSSVPYAALSDQEVQALDWSDDLDFTGLAEAIEQSNRFFRRLPQYYKFEYGDTVYSPKEMEASLELLLQTLRTFQGEERIRQIQKKFIFFESKNDQGGAFFTGYYEPILSGSLESNHKFKTPLYQTPNDLIKADLEKFDPEWEGTRIIGKVEGNQFIPYDSREKIVDSQSLDNRAIPIAYVENNIELFFLQIQGSGLLQLPDGSLKRVNYAAQNGHTYRSIGKLLIEENKIPREKMSMQALKAYLYQHPEEVRRILNHNPSYTFFREVDEGPLGYIEVPLTPQRSIAMDRKLVPRGGLAFITTQAPVFENNQLITRKKLHRFVLVQDTGGAIRGHGRADIFWGHGPLAELKAGHMQQTGRLFLLVARKEFLSPSLELISQH